MMENDRERENPAAPLRRLYILALSIIALLSISSQFLIQATLGRNSDDSRVVNLAGRQRMLSQRISKASLLILRAGEPATRAAPAEELASALALWRKSHDGLLHGDASLGLQGHNSAKVIGLFAAIEPAYQEMLAAADSLLALARDGAAAQSDIAAQTDRILAREREFLLGMDRITFQYDAETTERLGQIRLLEIAILLVTILTLTLEAFLIFRPAVRRIGGYFRELQNVMAILREQATIDGLTGLYNRATGLFILDREIERAKRNHGPLTLGFIDLDGLKAVNDVHGHEEGDRLIAGFAELLRSSVRGEDAAFRYGGDEFGIVLAQNAKAAEAAIERLRRAVAGANATGERPWKMAFSCGLAEFSPDRGWTAEGLIGEADERMYRQKSEHRAART